MKKVCIVMGSDSDLSVMEGCMKRLDAFGVPYEVRVVSAHRTPAAAETLAKNARADGFGVDHRGGRQGSTSGRRHRGVYHASGHRPYRSRPR